MLCKLLIFLQNIFSTSLPSPESDYLHACRHKYVRVLFKYEKIFKKKI